MTDRLCVPAVRISTWLPSSDRAQRTAGSDQIGPVAGLVFDVAGVLYDDTVWRRWLLQLVSRMGLHTQYTSFFRLWQREYLKLVYEGQLDLWDAWRKFLRSAGLSRAQVDEVAAAGHARLRQLEDSLCLLPQVAATLAKLTGSGVQLGALSSSPWSHTETKTRLARLGIAERFDTVVSAADLCRQQPGVCDFEQIADSLRLAPGRLAYVGRDTHQLDRARHQGLQTVAVNYDPDAVADLYLEQFADLLVELPLDSIHAVAG